MESLRELLPLVGIYLRNEETIDIPVIKHSCFSLLWNGDIPTNKWAHHAIPHPILPKNVFPIKDQNLIPSFEFKRRRLSSTGYGAIATLSSCRSHLSIKDAIFRLVTEDWWDFPCGRRSYCQFQVLLTCEWWFWARSLFWAQFVRGPSSTKICSWGSWIRWTELSIRGRAVPFRSSSKVNEEVICRWIIFPWEGNGMTWKRGMSRLPMFRREWYEASCLWLIGPTAQMTASLPFVRIVLSSSSWAWSGRWNVSIVKSFTTAALSSRTLFASA